MNKEIKKKAIGLFSGGLDSWLSALLIKRQDFDTYALHFVSPYFGYSEEKLKIIEKRLNDRGINLIVHRFGQDYIDDIVKNPKHGTGSTVNACLDCHRYMLQIAKKKMEEMGAEFVFTGEVLAQRPMSQRKEALNIVESESGLKGYLVRPLSAKVLKPSIPEENGILNRDLLMGFFGRGRKNQVELAKELGLLEYPQPAGGCKFTDPNIVKRFDVMLDINKNITWTDLELLKYFRHFYLGDRIYLITARDGTEVNKIMSLSDLGTIVDPKDIAGTTGLLIDYSEDKNEFVLAEKMDKAAQIIARYTKGAQEGHIKVAVVFIKDNKVIKELKVYSMDENELDTCRLF
ncbi:MAG: tRNA 4-thiouridine(8) synthase ThiI [bacterium]